MVELALLTGIPASVWDLEPAATVATALALIEERGASDA
jgi:hypothetical protein